MCFLVVTEADDESKAGCVPALRPLEIGTCAAHRAGQRVEGEPTTEPAATVAGFAPGLPVSIPAARQRYELIELIGRGGMATVWRARDRILQRQVAVKELVPPRGSTDTTRPDLWSSTLREARAAAQVTHYHAVRIYDFIVEPPRPWIVMEYIPGTTLHDIIERRGPLAPEYVATIGVALLDALHAAHRVGVLHRDVKPRNILVGHDGRIVLTDFGIALWNRVDGSGSGLVGTPQFMAPERIHDGTSVPAGDLWSLGATLYTAVEGQTPYARATAAETLAALATAPPDPPRYAGTLGPVLCDLLHRDPGQRPSVQQTRRRLLRVAGPAYGWHEPDSHGQRVPGPCGTVGSDDLVGVKSTDSSRASVRRRRSPRVALAIADRRSPRRVVAHR
jgi:serine/threonine protein kinase